jgi:hypothetical protein
MSVFPPHEIYPFTVKTQIDKPLDYVGQYYRTHTNPYVLNNRGDSQELPQACGPVYQNTYQIPHFRGNSRTFPVCDTASTVLWNCVSHTTRKFFFSQTQDLLLPLFYSIRNQNTINIYNVSRFPLFFHPPDPFLHLSSSN